MLQKYTYYSFMYVLVSTTGVNNLIIYDKNEDFSFKIFIQQQFHVTFVKYSLQHSLQLDQKYNVKKYKN
jgi:hypothetical protein